MAGSRKIDKNILIMTHGNSIWALKMYLEEISPENILEVNIPNSTPRIYVFDKNLKKFSANYLWVVLK